ncbi:MAG: ribosome maturation factor RimM [Actinomycetaceae bacterium]|nr:ribosome maturation factor RimM [Actinomycetaceae bacterium]
MDNEVVVGVLGSPRGLHGEIFAYSHTDSPHMRFAVGNTLIARDTGNRSAANKREGGANKCDNVASAGNDVSASSVKPEEVGIALTIQSTRESNRPQQPHQRSVGLFIRFEQITSKEQAQSLRGYQLYAQADNSEEDAFYPHQLKGLQVVDLHGKPLGVIVDIYYGQAQDLLVVRPRESDTKETVFVPFVQQIVPAVDLKKAQVVVDPPQGLFPGTDEPQQQEAQ